MNDIRIPYWRSRGRGFGLHLLHGFGIAMKQSLKDTQDHVENIREDYNCENCLNEVVVIAPKK